jgi:hypothetical protein
MYAFDYHKAHSLAEAAELLNANPEARLLAGGMSGWRRRVTWSILAACPTWSGSRSLAVKSASAR